MQDIINTRALGTLELVKSSRDDKCPPNPPTIGLDQSATLAHIAALHRLRALIKITIELLEFEKVLIKSVFASLYTVRQWYLPCTVLVVGLNVYHWVFIRSSLSIRYHNRMLFIKRSVVNFFRCFNFLFMLREKLVLSKQYNFICMLRYILLLHLDFPKCWLNLDSEFILINSVLMSLLSYVHFRWFEDNGACIEKYCASLKKILTYALTIFEVSSALSEIFVIGRMNRAAIISHKVGVMMQSPSSSITDVF